MRPPRHSTHSKKNIFIKHLCPLPVETCLLQLSERGYLEGPGSREKKAAEILFEEKLTYEKAERGRSHLDLPPGEQLSQAGTKRSLATWVITSLNPGKGQRHRNADHSPISPNSCGSARPHLTLAAPALRRSASHRKESHAA